MKTIFMIFLTSLLMIISGGVGAQSSDDSTSIVGNTIAIVNLRSGPGTGFGVVKILENQQPLVFVGRNSSSTWLRVRAAGVEGWLSYTFVNVEGNVMHLPISNGTVQSDVPAGRVSIPESGAPPAGAPVEVIPGVSATVRQIFLRGQELGNYADVFAKVGDSITASDYFLDPIGNGGLVLHDYEYLAPVVEYFSQTPAGDHFSFANTSLSARSGWTTMDVLDPARATPGVCGQNEIPLVCEYRLTRPSIALIMLGTNDAGWIDSNRYRENLSLIVQISIDMGVIPVLSTIPDQFGTLGAGRVGEFNAIIRSIAGAYDVPLWDYWLAMQPLPNLGLSSDGVHPSSDPVTAETAIFTPDGLRYGYNMRNLTALMVLDKVWREAMY